MAAPVLISVAGLTALTWVFTTAAIILTGGRFLIRLKTAGHLLASDYINGAACAFLIGYMATYTAFFNLYYAVEFYAAGAGPAVSDSDLIVYFKTEAAVSMLFWVIIYLVKASFLMLYHSLFKVSTRFMQVWWAVSVFTALCWLVSFIAVLWECGPDPAQNLFQPEPCLSEDAITASVNVVKMQCALNVFSDVLIILLPVFMLRTLQMRFAHKVGLGVIFAIALVDVAFDILRTVYTLDGGAVAIDTIWDILEPAIAVMVCAMPTYRNTFSIRKKPGKDTSYYALENSKNPTMGTSGSSANKSYGSSRLAGTQTSIEDPYHITVEHSFDMRTDAPRNVSHVV